MNMLIHLFIIIIQFYRFLNTVRIATREGLQMCIIADTNPTLSAPAGRSHFFGELPPLAEGHWDFPKEWEGIHHGNS
jgi:hypothetical protein